jgi:hypothetical protein
MAPVSQHTRTLSPLLDSVQRIITLRSDKLHFLEPSPLCSGAPLVVVRSRMTIMPLQYLSSFALLRTSVWTMVCFVDILPILCCEWVVDENRGHLLEAGLPQAIVSLLEGYAEPIGTTPQREPLPISIPHLKVVKTAIGVLLNVSINYGMFYLKLQHQSLRSPEDPVKFRLTSLEAAVTIMKLSTAIYPPGSWAKFTPQPARADSFDTESWTLRCGLSNWVWRAVSELKDVKDECGFQSSSSRLFTIFDATLS